MKAAALAAIVMALGSEASGADIYHTDCPVPPGYVAAKFPDEMPSALKREYPDFKLSDLGAPCCDQPATILLFVWHRQRTWIVGYLAEAFADHEGTDVFRLNNDGTVTKTASPAYDNRAMMAACENATRFAKGS